MPPAAEPFIPPRLLWLTDERVAPERTLQVATALRGLAGVAVMFRDKRPAPDWSLAAALIELELPCWLNADGAERRIATLGAAGFHAPEALWRARQSEPAAPAGLLCLADHDGDGQRQACIWRLPCVLISPLFVDKGRPARGASALLPTAGGCARLGLGGIDSLARAELALRFGCDGVALQRALYQHPAPRALAQQMLALWARAPR